MGIFSFFRSRQKGSAVTAKERLQVLIAHQHTDSDGPDYLPLLKQDILNPLLKQDILNVIKKYVDIGEEQVMVQLESQDDCDVLELNITLPDDSADATNDRTGKQAAITKKTETTSKKGRQQKKKSNRSSGKSRQQRKRESISN